MQDQPGFKIPVRREKGSRQMIHSAFLLRGIGPETHKKLTMKALEAACRNAGLPHTTNLLATGNLIIKSEKSETQVVSIISEVLAKAGVHSAVLVRSIDYLEAIAALNPFPEAVHARPSQVLIFFATGTIADEAIDLLGQRCQQGETIARLGDDMIIDFHGPVSTSRLTIAFIERMIRCTTTARNWNTVQKIVALRRSAA
jgi:uncharacterized protein (DUF1697 family)